MRLDHEFTVPASVEKVWQAVLDPERVAPCMPGATLSEVDGDTFRGSVKVKLGPVNLLYKGSGEFKDKDEQARRLVIKASGKDSRGSGTAAATVTVTLTAEGAERTKGAVATDLNVTGRPAQFGRGMISDVGGKILDSFAECLASELGGSGAEREASAEPRAESAPASATSPTSASAPADAPKLGEGEGEGERPHLHAVPDEPESEAIDLMEYAGSSVAKRLIPALAGVAALGAVLAAVKLLRDKRRSR